MSFSFERPIGAAADARELEYIAALHQTRHDEVETFVDGSIEATDVKNYLLSRYGINVTKEEVRKLIFYDLAGGDDDDDCIDIMEIVAILIIPYLVKVALINENFFSQSHRFSTTHVSEFEREALMNLRRLRGETDESIISDVLRIILSDVTGSDQPQRLTKSLLHDIFKEYGQDDMIEDDALLEEMIEVASGGESGAMLDSEAFIRGLTSDIKLYNPINETKFTTHYEDVFGMVTYAKEKNTEEDIRDEDSDIVASDTEDAYHEEIKRKKKEEGVREVQRTFTFPQIDFLADSFRDKVQYMLVWIAVLSSYLTYVNPQESYGVQICSEEYEDLFRCKVGTSIIVWFIIMALMWLLAAPAFMILSLGNNVHRHSLYEIGGALLGIFVLIFLPIWQPPQGKIISATVQGVENDKYFAPTFRMVNIVIGCLLVAIQVCNIIRFIVPDDTLRGSKFLTLILRGTGVRSEFGIKKATAVKVHKLITNAYTLHTAVTDDSMNRTSKANALLNYNKELEKRETSGGFIWAWKQFFSGAILDHEGIWSHTRLAASNLAQLLLVISLPLFIAALATDAVREIYSFELDGDNTPKNLHCNSVFDPNWCTFPQFEGNSAGVGICMNVSLQNSTCVDHFVQLEGFARNGFCYLLEEAGINDFFNGTCPELFAPFPKTIYTRTEGSVNNDYCTAPVGACTPTSEDYSTGICIIGFEYALPFQFLEAGSGCSNYTSEGDDFDLLLSRQKELEVIAQEQTDEFMEEYFPKLWMARISLGIGIVAALLVGLANSLVSIPSQVITTLKYRTGVFESLRDPKFKSFRVGMLQTTYLFGASIWGTIFNILLVFVFVTIGVFLSVYQVTAPFVLTFLSLLIGVLTTMIVKLFISLFLNKYSFVGYYRRHPLVANISNLAFECWHIAITSGYVVIRIVKLMIIVVIFIGRFDRPLLAAGIGEIGPIRLDNFPHVFKMDLLATDAHRHPYIERLGMMYMMKLRHGSNFGRKSGSIWRLLFVFALMPWLRKYRISNEETSSKNSVSEDEDGIIRKQSNDVI